MNKKVCIKGDGTVETGKRIIEYFEGLGGVNYHEFDGTCEGYYFIDDIDNYILMCLNMPNDREIIARFDPTPAKTFPREMWVWDRSEPYGRAAIVDGMYKDTYVVKIEDDSFETYKNAKDLPPKPLTTDEKIADLQRQIDELKNSMK